MPSLKDLRRGAAFGMAAVTLSAAAATQAQGVEQAKVEITANISESCVFNNGAAADKKLTFVDLTKTKLEQSKTTQVPLKFSCTKADGATVSVTSDGSMDHTGAANSAKIPYKLSATARGASGSSGSATQNTANYGDAVNFSLKGLTGSADGRLALDVELTARVEGGLMLDGSYRYTAGAYSDVVTVSATVK